MSAHDEEIEMPHPRPRVLLAGLATTVMIGVPPASARHHDDEVREEGRCARGIWWRMEAKTDDGRIEIEVEVDTDRVGQRWTWVLAHNDSRSDRGVSRTRGPSGTFEIERTAVDVPGTDTFWLRAFHRAVVCVARVTL